MKMKFNKKHISIGIIALIVICAAILFFFLCFKFDSLTISFGSLVGILTPILWGLVIGYLFTPLVNFFERRFLFPLALRKKDTISVRKKKLLRALSIFIAMIIFYGLLVLFALSVIPQIVESIKTLSSNLDGYFTNISDYVSNMYSNIQNWDIYKKLEELDIISSNSGDGNFITTTVLPEIKSLMPYVADFAVSLSQSVIGIFTGLANFVIGLFVSIYVLFNKEIFAAQAKKIMYCLFSKARANLIIKDTRFISDTFIGFLVGKIIDSIIIGILCFIGVTILNMPADYRILISVLVGVTNIVPVFGPFIGGIPSAIIVIVASSADPNAGSTVLYNFIKFAIFIVVLQQLDGNVIGPKILGGSTGISSFWVIFSIIFFGGLWGIFGMIIGIPIFAVFYAMVKRKVERRLKDKAMPVETNDYYKVKRIDNDGTIVELFEADVKNFKHIPRAKRKLMNNKITSRLDKMLNKDAEEKEEFTSDAMTEYQEDREIVKEEVETKKNNMIE